MSKPIVLIIEDEHALASALGATVTRLGATPKFAASGAAAIKALAARRPAAMILDIGLPDISGLEVLERVFPDGVDLPVVVVTAHGSLENAIAAKRRGVAEYLTKPLDLHVLEGVLGGLLTSVPEPPAIVDEASEVDRGPTMIGASAAMQRVFRELAHACTTTVPVVIGGASGTGKTLAARVIHANADSGGELRRLECGEAEAAELVDEITAGKGDTVLLENADRLTAAAQAALLSQLELGAGGRVISTAREPLHKAVGDGSFREDLYYRLRGVEIRLPTLAERLEDIPALAAYFLGRACADRSLAFADEALEVLCDRDWPGNVRELRNAVEYGVSVCGGALLLPQHLPPEPDAAGAKGGGLDAAIGRWLQTRLEIPDAPTTYSDLLDEVERVLLTKLLKRYGGKPTHLAAELEMNRTTLRKRLTRLGIIT